MKKLATQQKSPVSRVRHRDGYEPSWWGKAALANAEPAPSYWVVTRAPITCLVFVLPILLTYELGIELIGGESADRVRTGADAWIRRACGSMGVTDRWLPATFIVVSLLIWQAFRSQSWRFRVAYLVGMAAESLLLAFALVGLGRLLNMGFDQLESGTILQAESQNSRHITLTLLSFLGAGIYEEALFRLGLIPLLYRGLKILHAHDILAGTLAVTASSALFSLAHHAGLPGESFTWFAFVFRWIAGIFFAWVFLVRGFGIAVGTHAVYDVLVGWAGVQF